MSYLDTSVIVSLLTGETSAGRIRLWLNNRQPKPLLISDWSLTETSSALSLKLRTDQITMKAYEAAQTQFRLLAANSLEVLPVLQQHFYEAARYCDQHSLGLRSGDALHLAVAMELNAEIITLDKRFATAAQSLGAPCTLL